MGSDKFVGCKIDDFEMLPDSGDSGDVGLPAVGDLSLVGPHCTDGVGEIGMGWKFREMKLKGGERDGLAYSVK